MNSFWRFLRDKRNQQVLGWLGGGLIVAATGLWAAFVYFFPPPKSLETKSEPVPASVQADRGGIAIGGNVTGATNLNRELMAKRLEILRELLPNETGVGLLVNPNNLNTDSVVRELREVSQSRGFALHVVAVTTKSELDTAIANLVQAGAGSFMYALDSLFASSFDRLAALASHYRIPAIYHSGEAVANGGLMSYGGRPADEWRLVGQYTARILKGERPGDLPVQRLTKVELILNLKTAKALGLTVPPALLATADEVIE